MARQRVYKDHVMTSSEKSRRHADRFAAIDSELDEAFANVDWERRKEAEKDIVKWVNTYCIGLELDDAPPPKGEQVLKEMECAVRTHGNYMICMSRGSGKSCYTICTTLYAIVTGLQKYVVIISNNARSAGSLLQDTWRAIAETDTPFAQDYPEICIPFQLCKGSFRRRQMYRGKATEIAKNSGNIVFARLQDKDGKELPTSGSLITVRGISSGLRGMKHGTLRPTMVLLDDLQTSEIAENAEQVNKLLTLIKKDVMCLGGKERLSILQTATPIQPEDLVEHIKEDTNWKTSVFAGIIKFPVNMKLWEEYFRIFDRENIDDQTHEESLNFYRENKEKMDEGSEVFNPSRYSEKDGHISAIQKLMELRHVIGEKAFAAEYQMQPQRFSYALNITPKIVCAKTNSFKKLQVPDGYTFVAASTDLNLSYAMSTVLVAFKPDMTGIVLAHIIKKCKVDFKLPEVEFNQKVFQLLLEHGKELKALGVKIDGWGIDSTGAPFEAVTSFAKVSFQACGVPACAMSGKASHVFNGYVRSRLRDEINQTVLCGDAQEHIKAGSGKKYQFWNSDLYRERVHKAFLAPVGADGSLSIYDGDIEEHMEYATQVCNERLLYVKHRQDGRNEYTWKSADPHDFLDATAQAYAVAASQGISGQNFKRQQFQRKHVNAKKRFKIV